MTKKQLRITRITAVGTISLFVLTVSFLANGGFFNLQNEVSAQGISESLQNVRNTDESAPQACSLIGTLGTATFGGSTGNLAIRLTRPGAASASTCSSAVYPGTSGASGTFAYNVHNILPTHRRRHSA